MNIRTKIDLRISKSFKIYDNNTCSIPFKSVQKFEHFSIFSQLHRRYFQFLIEINSIKKIIILRKFACDDSNDINLIGK